MLRSVIFVQSDSAADYFPNPMQAEITGIRHPAARVCPHCREGAWLASDGVWGRDMRDALIALPDSPRVQDHVTFLGVTNEIVEALARAEFFVLSSRYEGFPDALLEAMACGVATLSFDRRSGPAEIVTDGVNGVLVAAGDEMVLADTMLTLIGEPERRARLGDAAAKSMERYDRNRVMDGWELLLPATAGMCGAEIHCK